MEYLTRKLNVVLTDEEYQFITKLAQHDKMSFYEELHTIFRFGLDYLSDFYAHEDFMK